MIKKILKTILGVILILIGIMGLFLPILPGIVLMLAGISLIHPALYKKIIKKFKTIKIR